MNHIQSTRQILRGLNRNARLYLAHSVFSGLSIALLALLYNLYIGSLGYKQDMIGTVTLVASVVGVAAALPGGYVLGRLGYRRAFSAAVLGTAASIALPLALPTSEALILTELIWGVSFTLLIIAGGPFMSENSDEFSRAHLFSIQFVLTVLTGFAGNLLGGELPRLFGGWGGVAAEAPQAYQGALWVSVFLMLASALPFWFLSKPAPRKHARGAPRAHLAVKHPQRVSKLLTPHVLGALGAGMIVPFANVLWKTTYQLPDSAIGGIFAVSALGMAALGIVSPFLTTRLGTVRVMVAAQAIAALGLLGFGVSPIYGLALGSYLVRDGLSNALRPLYGQFMMEQSEPGERAAVSSLATMGFNLAWGVSSWVSGVWQTQNEWLWVFLVGAFFTLLSAATMQWFFAARGEKAPAVISAPVGTLTAE